MKKYLLIKQHALVMLLFLYSICGFSQEVKLQDTLARYSFEELSKKFYAAKPDSLRAVMYAKYYINKAQKEKDTIELGSAYYRLSDITRDSTYFVKYWNRIIKTTKNTKNSLYPSFSYLKLGDYYFHQGEKDKALKNYLLSKNQFYNSDSLKSFISTRLGMLSQVNKDYDKSISLYNEAYKFYSNKAINFKMSREYYSLLINLAIANRLIKKYDLAISYTEEALLLAKKFNQHTRIGYVIYSKAKIFQAKKDNISAIKFLKESLPNIISDENFTIVSSIYNSIGVSYWKLNHKKSAINYFSKVDSLFLIKNKYYSSQKPAYKYLLNYYKEQKNDSKHLEYINKYITIDSVLNARSKNISKNLTENYDIPNLLAEKKAIENRLKEDLSTSKKWILAIFLLVMVLLTFLINQTRKRSNYKKRFETLLAIKDSKVETQKTIQKKATNIPEDVVKHILRQLNLFEKEHQFIASDITLANLAKSFETNSKYLSQLINLHKEKSFNNYINELRIMYTVDELKTNATFRKYSVKAIANEVGFNTTESFSKAFFKNTGIKPSFFIKELEKNN